MKMYCPPCFARIVDNSDQQRPPAKANNPLTNQTNRDMPQDPTFSSMELEVMKMPEPIMVPATNDVVPTCQ